MERNTQPDTLSAFGRFVRRFNVPNVLTTIRILLIPIFLWVIAGTGAWQDVDAARADRWWALVVFLLLMVTDQLDGYLARKYEVITDFGKLADPIADKLLMLAAFISLNLLGELWWTVTAVIVVRELGITLWRLVLARRGRWFRHLRAGSSKPCCKPWPLRFTLCRWPVQSPGSVTGSWL